MNVLLAIDCGNTNICIALFDQAQITHKWRFQSNRYTEDELGLWLAHSLSLSGISPALITDVCISSVVPDLVIGLVWMARKYFQKEAYIIESHTLPSSLQVLITPKQGIGADLVVNAIAGRALYKPPLIILDFGTALTFSEVSPEGYFCGCAIAPGVNTAKNSLIEKAAKLPSIEVKETQHVINATTIECFQSGCYWGYISMCEGMIQRIKQEMSKRYNLPEGSISTVATGGISSLFKDRIKFIDYFNKNLTLQGIYEVYKHVRNRSTN